MAVRLALLPGCPLPQRLGDGRLVPPPREPVGNLPPDRRNPLLRGRRQRPPVLGYLLGHAAHGPLDVRQGPSRILRHGADG